MLLVAGFLLSMSASCAWLKLETTPSMSSCTSRIDCARRRVSMRKKRRKRCMYARAEVGCLYTAKVGVKQAEKPSWQGPLPKKKKYDFHQKKRRKGNKRCWFRESGSI
jgi:hypothetical protein